MVADGIGRVHRPVVRDDTGRKKAWVKVWSFDGRNKEWDRVLGSLCWELYVHMSKYLTII